MSQPIDISIIVPTYMEGENLPLLLPRIDAALAGRAYEVIVVDDASPDDTPRVCTELAARFPLRLISRQQPKDGLGGAVLEGLRVARGDYLVVMDADLQHPPERIPDLLRLLESGQADFAIGSRRVPGARTDERWGTFRRLNSRVATLLARPFAGRTADPMSGFFALRRGTFESAQRLTPLGYKIGLELMCKCAVQRVGEVPIHFATRARGRSKLTFREQFRYLEHLSRLYDFTYPRLAPIAKFLIVTALGWLAGMELMMGLRVWGWSLPAATTAGYGSAILITAIFHLRYVRTQREFIVARRPWGDFLLISAAEWIACGLAAWWLDARLAHPQWWEVLVGAFATATIVRYILRKEFMQDIRGLRRDVRADDRAPPTRDSQ